MILSDWDEVGDLVDEALSRPGPARDALLSDACGDDIVRMARARLVLAAAARAEGFLERSAIEPRRPRRHASAANRGDSVTARDAAEALASLPGSRTRR